MTNTIINTAIDFIGDIHGHAQELEELLEAKLNYVKTNGYYHIQREKYFLLEILLTADHT